MEPPLALYRRYRPTSFDEVIGQSHVTEPLKYALANNRVHHAYLFSGPRGCGKTTSARILARQLNGVAPDDTSEQIDIIEIDAASHGGVDDARDLRERAFFAPVNSPYKIYIVDEAHMVSSQGFNALLKLVEEPPAHLKFIFATTEPDKVIGTIRSRTHHYPFRLVPPKLLSDYLSMLCEKEGVTIEPTALPLIVRAGAGSVRDTLSVLDQLLGGAGPDGVTYDLAVALLGYTPDSLLDEVIDALAAGDGSSVFGAIDKVIETGQDPRRFAEDLLQRLRDLIIVAAVPDAIEKALLDIPDDMAERLSGQAARFGPSELTRSADIVSAGLTELRGATAPRLLLELMCSRILLPAADHSSEGVGARLDRLERRMSIVGDHTASGQPAARPAPVAEVTEPPTSPEPTPAATPAEPTPAATSTEPPPPEPEAALSTPEPTPEAEPPTSSEPQPTPEPEASADEAPTADGDATRLTVVDVRRLWPDVLERVMRKRRFTWVMLSQNAQVHSIEGNVLTLSLVNAGARDSFARSGSDEILRQALIDEFGADLRIEAIVDPSAQVESPAAPTRAAPDPAPARTPEPSRSESSAVREAIRPTRSQSSGAESSERAAESDSVADRDDPSVGSDDLDPEALLASELGATVIDETPSD
ncbi:DNA polymerase III subunit gamma and tau [Solicola gregarius]|uniref:DNA polymerase III subunit gamma/tau n=1 Tax=Solicola gregarius TaxID=2908642 RepID=A0AA46TLV4_9ACTN|nr:DNA polymerase III subunit gamma and tau [Solicola gregarius]UYM07704.1 DNA polymerase III subunit gamma and tau [Solicola gregarius]